MHLLRTAAGAWIALTTSTGTILAQAAPADHWRLIPAPASACFNDDDFFAKLDAATVSINAEIDKQKATNAAAKEKFDNMDMMEKAQRMQAFMMKNPQAAAKMMQAEQAAGSAAAADATSANSAVQRLDAELTRHNASFRSAIDAAIRPLRAKQADLIKAKSALVGEVQEPMFTNTADHAQYVQLIAEENAAAEKACAAFFGANGTYHKWLASYRTEVVDRTVSLGNETDIMIMQMAAMDLPGGGYKSTTGLEQSINYLQKMRTVYGVRPNRAKPTVGLKK